MENSGILNWRKWSLAKKGVVLGAILGTLVTGVLSLLIHFTGDLVSIFLWLLVLYPTGHIYHLFGWYWGLGTSSPNTLQIVCSAILINSLLLAMVGGMSGWIIGLLKRNKTSGKNSILLCILFPVVLSMSRNAYAHEVPVHVRITESAALVSSGLTSFLSDQFSQTNAPFIRVPKLVFDPGVSPKLFDIVGWPCAGFVVTQA